MRDLCETIKTSALSLPTRYHDQLTEQRGKPTPYTKGVRYDNILVTGKKTKLIHYHGCTKTLLKRDATNLSLMSNPVE